MTNNKGVSPIAAGVVGAAVGVAAGATAVALSDEKNRKKVENAYSGIKKTATDVGEKLEAISSTIHNEKSE